MAVSKKFYGKEDGVQLDTRKGISKFPITNHGLVVAELHVVTRKLADKIPVERPGCYFNIEYRNHTSNKVMTQAITLFNEFLKDNELEFRGSRAYTKEMGEEYPTLERRYILPECVAGTHVIVKTKKPERHLLITTQERGSLFEQGLLSSAVHSYNVAYTPAANQFKHLPKDFEYRNGYPIANIAIAKPDSCAGLEFGPFGDISFKVRFGPDSVKRGKPLVFPNFKPIGGIDLFTLDMQVLEAHDMRWFSPIIPLYASVPYLFKLGALPSGTSNKLGFIKGLAKAAKGKDVTFNGGVFRQVLQEVYDVEFESETSLTTAKYPVKLVNQFISDIAKGLTWEEFKKKHSARFRNVLSRGEGDARRAKAARIVAEREAAQEAKRLAKAQSKKDVKKKSKGKSQGKKAEEERLRRQVLVSDIYPSILQAIKEEYYGKIESIRREIENNKREMTNEEFLAWIPRHKNLPQKGPGWKVRINRKLRRRARAKAWTEYCQSHPEEKDVPVNALFPL